MLPESNRSVDFIAKLFRINTISVGCNSGQTKVPRRAGVEQSKTHSGSALPPPPGISGQVVVSGFRLETTKAVRFVGLCPGVCGRME
jgi:hypothetical protein